MAVTRGYASNTRRYERDNFIATVRGEDYTISDQQEYPSRQKE